MTDCGDRRLAHLRVCVLLPAVFVLGVSVRLCVRVRVFLCFLPCPLLLADRVDVRAHLAAERLREGALGAAAGQLPPDMAALSAGEACDYSLYPRPFFAQTKTAAIFYVIFVCFGYHGCPVSAAWARTTRNPREGS